MTRKNRNAESRRTGSGNRLVTPVWLKEQKAKVAALRYARETDPGADTTLIIVAAQHPLVAGKFPGREFKERLNAAHTRYLELAIEGRKAELFLPGSRHYDSASNRTDEIALYDAAGRWLVNRGVPGHVLHGKDWIDAYSPEGVYSGAAEIKVAAAGFINNPRFRGAEYICSPGQTSRAATYALASGIPLAVTVPLALEQNQEDQFHGGFLQNMILTGVARAIDPYGDGILKRITQDRIPEDGVIGTSADRLPLYEDLPWYSQADTATPPR
jgi:hypothetical protein